MILNGIALVLLVLISCASAAILTDEWYKLVRWEALNEDMLSYFDNLR